MTTTYGPADLFRIQLATAKVRQHLTPAEAMRMTGVELEWTCMARRWVPELTSQLLEANRERARLERELASARRALAAAGAPA